MLKKLFLILLLLIIALTAFYQYQKFQAKAAAEKIQSAQAKNHTPPDYLIILVGDSMTEYIGNSTEMRQYLSESYPGKTFDIYNYGFGSTNILSIPSRLTDWTNRDRAYQPILDIDADLVILESMGHNPLSQFPLEEGLRKQNQALEVITKLIKERRPNTKLAYLTTISPNSKTNANNAVELSDETRVAWVKERISYIKNHEKFAKDNNIPLIDVFSKSLDKNGDGNLTYIEDKNYIHPSPKGILLLQREIADFVYNNNLLD